MKIENMRHSVRLDEKDYFYVERWEGGYRLTVCEGKGMPLHFTGLTDRQLLGLGSQVQKAFVLAQEERMKKLFAEKEKVVFAPKEKETGGSGKVEGTSRPATAEPILIRPVTGFVC